MKTYYVLAFVALLFLSVQGQICAGGTEFEVTSSSMCQVPGGVSCCGAEYEEIVRQFMQETNSAEYDRCLAVVAEIYCIPCMPTAFWLDGDFIMCKGFCNRLADACGSGSDFASDIFQCNELPDRYCFDGLNFPKLPPRKICGQFGDPHILTFDREGFTCGGADKNVTLAKTDKFHLTAYNEAAPESSNGATITTRINLHVYGEGTDAAPELHLLFTVDNPKPFVNSSHAHIRNYGNNYLITNADARLQVFNSRGSLVFGLATPDTGDSNSWCSSGCPNDKISARDFIESKRSSEKRDAELACQGLDSNSFEYEACVFDVVATGDSKYASVAADWVEVNKDFLKEEETRAYMFEHGSASALMVSVAMLLAAIAMLF